MSNNNNIKNELDIADTFLFGDSVHIRYIGRQEYNTENQEDDLNDDEEWTLPDGDEKTFSNLSYIHIYKTGRVCWDIVPYEDSNVADEDELFVYKKVKSDGCEVFVSVVGFRLVITEKINEKLQI